jgi:peptidyl-prolyl cis-trans isomerase SurA
MTEFNARVSRIAALLWALAALAPAALLWPHGAAAQARAPTGAPTGAPVGAPAGALRNGDYIVAVVNQELVTAGEVERRVSRAREEAARAAARLPPEAELKRQVVDALVEERVILSYARDSGPRVDEADVDRAVQTVAAQNQMTMPQLQQRLRADGSDLPTFRNNLRDQLLVERTREREVYQRIRVTDGDVDRYLEKQRTAANVDAEINLAQILVTVPDGAAESAVAERRALAERALARVRAGEAFEVVAREVSEDANRQRGGEIGLRPASRLPDLFNEAVKGLKKGDVTVAPVRSGAGFHVLKVLESADNTKPRVTQTRARHILLRPSAQLSQEQAQARLAGYRRQIDSKAKTFEEMARQYSEDGSAAQGGDLGWAAPGVMVPEFDEAMGRLDLGGLSQPVVSRFGVHLIQVLERRQVDVDPKQLREQARNALREQKFEEAYNDWASELRSRAYIEMREPPL